MKDYKKAFISEVKKLTELINFDCNCFDRTSTVFMDNKYIKVKGMGCCAGCYYNLGYGALREHNIHKFKKGIGFWRKNKGCILDREDRSMICIMYSCKNQTKDQFEIKRVIYNLICDRMIPLSTFPKLENLITGDTVTRLNVTEINMDKPRIKWPDSIEKPRRAKILRLRRLAIYQEQG